MRTLDWNTKEAQAVAMSRAELRGALDDILRTLPNADALDREDGGDRGGYYRDEASVYRRELASRNTKGTA
jgi:hypothetical protein